MTSPHDLQAILEAADVGTWVWDPTSGRVVWDATTERLYGLEAGMFGGTFENFVELLYPDDRADVLDVILKSSGEGGIFNVRHRVERPDGQVVALSGRGFIRLDEAGAMERGSGIVYDSTGLDAMAPPAGVSLPSAIATTPDRRRIQLLLAVDRALATSLNATRLARNLVDELVTSRVQFAAIDLLDSTAPGVVATYAKSATDVSVAERRSTSSDDGSPARQRLGIGEMTVLRGAETQQVLSDLPEIDPKMHTIVAPLVAHGRRVGTLVLSRKTAFTQGSKQIISAVADRAGAAFDRAAAFAQHAKVTAAVREAALPGTLEAMVGVDAAASYRPARDATRLGGDFYDLIPIDPGRAVAVVGDVCGKGTDAAMRAMPARMALRTALLAGAEPLDVLAGLNTAFRGGSDFLTLVMVAMERLADGSLHADVYCAGHEAPVLVSDKKASRLAARGTLLGVEAEVSFETDAVALDAGDILLLHTDGVVEARTAGRMFGDERLLDALSDQVFLSAGAVLDRVGMAIDSWTDANPAEDDVAMLAIRVL